MKDTHEIVKCKNCLKDTEYSSYEVYEAICLKCQKQVVVLESDCVCADEDGPDYGECFGCYDDAKDNLKYLINAWVDAQGKEFSEVRIDGTGMGWQRQSGYAHTDIDDIAHALALRGDFRIIFTLENGELTATRSSHDEPTGAHFTFTPSDTPSE